MLEASDTGTVCIEWLVYVLGQPFLQLLSGFNAIEQCSIDNFCRLESFQPPIYSFLQIIDKSRLQEIREKHAALLKSRPQEAVLEGQADSEDAYLQQCYEAFPQTLLLEMNKQFALSKETFLEQSQKLRGMLWGETLLSKELRQLWQRLKQGNLTLIPAKEIKLIRRLGEGNCGEVYQGYWQGTKVAVKVLKSAAITVHQEPPQLLPATSAVTGMKKQ